MIHTLSSDKEKALFRASIDTVTKDNGIGTLNEKMLHAVIKHYIEPDACSREVKISSSVVDVFNSDGIFEIQTRSFERLAKKLPLLLEISKTTVVLPIPHVKTVSWIDKNSGEITSRRKSPKTGSVFDALYELSKIKGFISNENLRIRIMLIDMDEYRNLDGWGKGGKRGSTRHERIPTDIFAEYIIESCDDCYVFIPKTLNNEFTLKEFAKAAKISPRCAQLGIYFLRECKTVTLIGKKGRENLYQLSKSSSKLSSPSIAQNPASAE